MTQWIMVVAAIMAPFQARSDAEGTPDRKQASEALRRAVAYATEHLATEGGYLWKYSLDLKLREGEGAATDTQVWVQPPGTPAMGLAFLSAYEATGEDVYLSAAKAVGQCLAKGQLQSGGWEYLIEFDPKKRERYAYRVDPERPKARNESTLDDNTTQSALRFLMRLDEALKFQDPQIHAAALFALKALKDAQYPHGGWPQRFRGPADPAMGMAVRASYPEEWSRTFEGEDYRGCATLNDNLIGDLVETLVEASRIYKDKEWLEVAMRAGDFLIAAQMPEPQPAWAQQYNERLQPVWARKFEPPSVTGGESQGACRTLMRLYDLTGQQKYLEPVPRAIEYLEKSRLEDGQLARFYELKTNRPLFFTKNYVLTYDGSDTPTHYAFRVGDKTESLRRELDRLTRKGPSPEKLQERPSRPELSSKLQQEAARVIKSLDNEGRWVEQGSMREDDTKQPVLDMATLARNIQTLAAYLAATAEK